MIGLQVRGNFGFPLVAIAEQLFLVVKQLLVRLRGEFKVRSFHDGVNWASLLCKLMIQEYLELASYKFKLKGSSPDRNRSRYTWSCRYRSGWFACFRQRVPLPQW